MKSETVTRSPIVRRREVRPAFLLLSDPSIILYMLRQEGAGRVFHIICNPIAGKGRVSRFRRAVEAGMLEKGMPFRFYETDGPGDALRTARRLTAGGSGDVDIVVMGGDGTLNEVLNGLEDPSMVRLGLIPCGSGNDFAAVAGIPATPEGALDLLLNGAARYTDYLECGGVRGINAIGTGIDVEILRRYNRMKLLKGSAAYLASLILTLRDYQAKRFDEVSDGGRRSHNALIACVGNGRHIGGGISVCPEAVIDDGLMDIVIVDDIPRRRIPGAFLRLMKGQILDLPTTDFRRDSRLRLESKEPMPVQIDGEIYENLSFDVRVVSEALRVYRP